MAGLRGRGWLLSCCEKIHAAMLGTGKANTACAQPQLNSRQAAHSSCQPWAQALLKPAATSSVQLRQRPPRGPCGAVERHHWAFASVPELGIRSKRNGGYLFFFDFIEIQLTYNTALI